MKWLAGFLLGCSLLSGQAGIAEDRAVPVSIVQLIVTPEKFDGKLIAVTGFLTMGERTFLWLHREDAEHGLASNMLPLVRTDSMRREQEKLNGMYVEIVGLFHTARAEGGWLVSGIQDIRQCYVVSDPARPQYPYGKRRPPPIDK